MTPLSNTELREAVNKVLFKIRTTHEVEHNDNRWTTEFVYSLDEAKTDLLTLITTQKKAWEAEARFDELTKLGKLYNGSKIKYLDHYEERYKYLQLKRQRNESGGE